MGMQSEIADPYSVLGISRTATSEDLKRAYRKLSMAWHPDRHASEPDTKRQEAERRFKLINAAYVAVGEILRTKAETQTASTQASAVAHSDVRVEAIRSVVASAALRLIPNVPRHIYWRVVSMVEALLIDAIALGERAYLSGFEAAVREAQYTAGLGADARPEALKVLDAAVDDLQWRGKGADPETWQMLLAPLERARRGDKLPAQPVPRATTRTSGPSLTLSELVRAEPILQLAQGGLAILVLLLLLPGVPIAGTIRFLLLLVDIVVLGYITFGPRK